MTTKVWAVGMVKDEADIIDHTLRHLIASGVDGIVIADNMSTDGTRGIIERVRREAPIPIIIQIDDEPAYFQSQKMSRLMHKALDACESPWPFIVPFDADELLVCSTPGNATFGSFLRHASANAFRIPMTNYFPCIEDLANDNPFERIQHRHLPPNTLPKVVFRATYGMTIAQGSHSVLDTEHQPVPLTDSGVLRICHFPYRSAEHFIRKVVNGGRAYRASSLPEHQGAHWRAYYEAYERGGEQALINWFETYFFFRDDRMAELKLDPAPYLR